MANLYNAPEEFDGVWFTRSQLTVTADATAAPDGTVTMDKLVAQNLGGTGSAEIRNSLTLPTSTEMIWQCIFQPDTLTWVRMFTAAYDAALNVYIDLENKVVGTNTGTNTVFVDTLSDGSVRVAVQFTSHAIDTSGSFRMRLANANDDTAVALDGVSSIYAWGAYMDAGTVPAVYTSAAAIDVPQPVAYSLPSDFNDELGITINDLNGGSLWSVTGADVSDIDPFTEDTHTKYYVNYSTGNDSNDGLSSGNAVKTFDQAAVLAQALGAQSEIIIEDEIIGQNSLTTTAKSFTQNIKVSSGSVSGRTIISNIDEDLTPSWTDNLDNTFSATTGMADFPACFDHGTLDSDGIGTPMTSVASGAACVATAGSFYWDGVDTLMVHMPDAREPDIDFIYCPDDQIGRMNNRTTGAGNTVIMGYLTCYHNGGVSGGGGGFGARGNDGTGNTSKLGMKSCYSAGSKSNGFGILDFAVVVMQDCIAKYCREDGFNYHIVESSTLGRYMAVYENNCKATDCGYDGVFQDQPTRTTSSNCTSAHDRMRSFRINGYYERSYGPVIADVNGTYNFIVSCFASDPGLTGASAGNAAYYHGESVDPGSVVVGSRLVACTGDAVTSGSGAVMLSEDGTYGDIEYWNWLGVSPVTTNGTPTVQSLVTDLGLTTGSFMDGVMTEDEWFARRRRLRKHGRVGGRKRLL